MYRMLMIIPLLYYTKRYPPLQDTNKKPGNYHLGNFPVCLLFIYRCPASVHS